MQQNLIKIHKNIKCSMKNKCKKININKKKKNRYRKILKTLKLNKIYLSNNNNSI